MKTASTYAASRSFSAPAADWPQDRWWAGYQDPQLDKLIEEALAGSPDLAAAQARVDQRTQWPSRSDRTLGPQIDAVASAAEVQAERQQRRFRPPSSPHGWRDAGMAGARISNWQIDFFGKNRALLGRGDFAAEAARAEAGRRAA